MSDKGNRDELPKVSEVQQSARQTEHGNVPPGFEGDAGTPSRWSEQESSGTGGVVNREGFRDSVTQERLEGTGHGNARHGPEVTRDQHINRVQAGITPDGAYSPTPRSTNFDSQEAQLEAVNKAKTKADAMMREGRLSPTQATPDGTESPNRVELVVNSRPGGYGSGVEVERDENNQVKPGRPVQDTGQDPNALVRLQYNPEISRWDPVTQYPTNKPVTP